MRSCGNGSSDRRTSRARTRVTGPISTKPVSRTTLPGRRRVTGQAACESQPVRGLGELPARSARRGTAKRSRKPRGSSTSSSTTSSQSWPVGRVRVEQPVEVLELAALARAAQVCSSTSWRERSQLARDRASPSAACSGRSTPSTSTLRERRLVPRGARQAQAPAAQRARQRVDATSRAPRAATSSPPTVPLAPERKSSAAAGRPLSVGGVAGASVGDERVRAAPRAGARRCGRPSSARRGSGGAARGRGSRRASRSSRRERGRVAARARRSAARRARAT